LHYHLLKNSFCVKRAKANNYHLTTSANDGENGRTFKVRTSPHRKMVISCFQEIN
jgi:hypothetical protein